MKKSILIIMSVMVVMVLSSVQSANAQNVSEPWPGVTKKVLIDNDKVNVSEVTFATGAVATWHSHPQYTVYAVTDVKMQVEVKGEKDVIVELKAGEAMYSPAVTHQTTNLGKKSFTVIVTEIK
jgi:quercetin dioxygenase-like cupin family protein